LTFGAWRRSSPTAEFDPVGLLGQVYWYTLYPLHCLVFAGMLAGLARAALGYAASQRAAP